MPIFEFICSKCQHQFEVLVSNSEKYNVHCPDCGANDVQQKLSIFNSPKQGGASVGQSQAPSGCCGCARAGSCGMNF